MKTENLIGPALDWAVAKAEGRHLEKDFRWGGFYMCGWFIRSPGNFCRSLDCFNPSTDEAQGGPIITQERIATAPRGISEWLAYYQGTSGYLVGPTPLIAAMRCFVASKLGDEVDIPEELE